MPGETFFNAAKYMIDKTKEGGLNPDMSERWNHFTQLMTHIKQKPPLFFISDLFLGIQQFQSRYLMGYKLQTTTYADTLNTILGMYTQAEQKQGIDTNEHNAVEKVLSDHLEQLSSLETKLREQYGLTANSTVVIDYAALVAWTHLNFSNLLKIKADQSLTFRETFKHWFEQFSEVVKKFPEKRPVDSSRNFEIRLNALRICRSNFENLQSDPQSMEAFKISLNKLIEEFNEDIELTLKARAAAKTNNNVVNFKVEHIKSLLATFCDFFRNNTQFNCIVDPNNTKTTQKFSDILTQAANVVAQEPDLTMRISKLVEAVSKTESKVVEMISKTENKPTEVLNKVEEVVKQAEDKPVVVVEKKEEKPVEVVEKKEDKPIVMAKQVENKPAEDNTAQTSHELGKQLNEAISQLDLNFAPDLNVPPILNQADLNKSDCENRNVNRPAENAEKNNAPEPNKASDPKNMPKKNGVV